MVGWGAGAVGPTATHGAGAHGRLCWLSVRVVRQQHGHVFGSLCQARCPRSASNAATTHVHSLDAGRPMRHHRPRESAAAAATEPGGQWLGPRGQASCMGAPGQETLLPPPLQPCRWLLRLHASPGDLRPLQLGPLSCVPARCTVGRTEGRPGLGQLPPLNPCPAASLATCAVPLQPSSSSPGRAQAGAGPRLGQRR